MVLVAGSVDNKKILLGTCKLICMMIVWNGEIILMSCNVVWVLSYFDTDHIVTSACSLFGNKRGWAALHLQRILLAVGFGCKRHLSIRSKTRNKLVSVNIGVSDGHDFSRESKRRKRSFHHSNNHILNHFRAVREIPVFNSLQEHVQILIVS